MYMYISTLDIIKCHSRFDTTTVRGIRQGMTSAGPVNQARPAVYSRSSEKTKLFPRYPG